MKIILISVLTIIAVEGQHWFSTKEPPFRWSPPVRPDLPMVDMEQLWVTVPVDHFDSSNNKTFRFRYLSNDHYASSNDTLLIMVGGEWAINDSFLAYGTMFEIAKDIGAKMLYTEHRYYGISQPVSDLSTANLEYLSVDQALADLAYLITSVKEKTPTTKIVLFGGSYAGNMVVWFSQKYSHLIDGAVASSGPVLAQRNFWGYMQVVHDTILEEGGNQCVEVLTEAVKELRREMGTERGRKRIADAYLLCEPLNPAEQFDIEYFYAVITWGFAGMVQTASPGVVARECRTLTSEELGSTPFDRLARYVAGEPANFCQDIKYSYLIDLYSNTFVSNENRLWYYQTCTEFGYYQTSPSTGSIFDGLLSLEFYEEVCKRAYSEKFNSEFIDDAVNRTNMKHGGIEPKAQNLASVYGQQDPWHALGLRGDLGPSSPTFLVPKASHCFDLYGSSSSDTVEMANTKKNIAEIVKKWLEN